jgi:hypothetical protein
MAENTQTFILVGDFKDNITPSLKKLNTQIEALNKSFAKISKQLRPISKEFGTIAAASERFGRSLKDQRALFGGNVKTMQEYRKEARKVRAESDKLAKAQAQANREIQRSAGNTRIRGGAGAGAGGGIAGRGGRGSMAAAAGGLVAGSSLANMMTGAIVKGFNMGTNIMMKPFRYGANAIGERIQDEMSDISSAGGMFAVDRRENMGIFKSFDDARKFQEELNARLAQSAAALPGETAEYVQQAKMLTDSMMISFGKNKEAFMSYAKSIDTNVKGERDALGLVTQKFTEKAVLLGKGSGGSSAYGVPQILEMLLSQEQINVKAFHKFTAYRANPLFKNALEAAEGELKKTGKNSADRLRIIQKVLDEAVPNEVVMAMQNSADGIYQAVKSAFLDPEAGLLGFGRKIDAIKIKSRDSLGRFVNDAGEVVKTAAEAAEESASLFQLLREIVGGFVLPLTGLTDILPQLYDPLVGIANDLVGFRDAAQNFYMAFNRYTSWFETYSNQLDESGQKAKASMIRDSKKARGALAAINNLLASFGAINATEFQKNADQLKNVDTSELGGIAKRMFGQLFDSKFMEELGRTIGKVVGSTLKAVGDFMAGVAGTAESGPFAKGLKEGWDASGGAAGIKNIFGSLLKTIGNALLFLFKSAPFEMSIIAALTVGMAGLQGILTSALTALFETAGDVLTGRGGGAAVTKGGFGRNSKAFLLKQGRKAAALGGGVPGVGAIGKGGAAALSGAKMKGVGALAAGIVTIATKAPKLAKAGKAVLGLGKRIPLLSVALGGLDFAARKASGESNLKAIGGAGGSVIGGIAGAAIGQALIPIPGVGAVAGGALGSFIGDWLGSQIEKIPEFFAGLPAKFDSAISAVKSWWTTLPEELGGWLGATYIKIENWFKVELPLLGEKIKADLNKLKDDIGAGIQKFFNDAGETLSNPATWGSLAMKLVEGLKTAFMNTPLGLLIRGGAGAVDFLKRTGEAAKTGATVEAATSEIPKGQTRFIPGVGTMVWNGSAWTKAAAKGSPGTTFTSLGAAIQSEMANKPAGSKLVIANSSETIIPAASGYGDGVKGLIDAIWRSTADSTSVMVKGFESLMKATATGDQKIAAVTAQTGAQTKSAIERSIAVQTADTNKLMSAIKAASAFGGFGGGGGMALGSGYGSKGGAIAGALGNFIKQTGGAPGSIHEHPQHGGVKGRHAPGSYHYSGRAIDIGAYANEQAGVIARIQQFNAKHGVKPVEFLHAGNDPNHQDHVHVAYAHGINNPRLFTSAKAAAAYEGMMAPAGAKVQTITANTSENLGGHYTVNQNITISGAQDPRALAEAVFNYAAQAAEHINNTSFA